MVFKKKEKGVEKYPLPVSRQQRANGGITCRKEEFYRGVPNCMVIDSADETLRLSDLTLPHAFVRVLLAEALYRAWTVTINHPYHRE